MIRTPKFSRRRLLGGLGVSAAMLPLLPIFESESEAGQLGAPKRLILLTTPNGTVLEDWRPSGTENNFTLGPILAPLADYQDRMLVLDGIDEVAVGTGASKGHDALSTLWVGSGLLSDPSNECGCGFSTGASVDQAVAAEIGASNLLRSIQVGVGLNNNSARGRTFHAGENQPMPLVNDPVALFDQIFGELNLDPAAADKRRGERQSVIDLFKDEMVGVEASLGAADRIKLEQHLDAVHTLEQRLYVEVGANCVIPDEPDYLAPTDNDNLPQLTDNQFDLITAALSCDVTRVVGLQWGREGSTGRASWLGHGSGIHTTSHDNSAAGRTAMRDLNTWFSEKLAALMGRLAAVPEGDGTMLDNTLIVWAMPISQGWTHSNYNIPVVMFEGPGGHFQTGRYLRFGDYDGASPPYHDAHGGEPMNKVLVSICHAMGLSDVDTYGDPSLGSGPLAGLTG